MSDTPRPLWYRSLYWRVAIGFVAFLAVLLGAQALLFVWLTGRTAGAFPASSNERLAALVAADIRDELEADPAVDLGAHITAEYRRVVQPFVVVMADGRVFANRDNVPPALARNTRNRLTQMTRARTPRARRSLRPLAGGRTEAPIVVNGELAGLVAVPAVRIAPMAALQSLGPTLAASGLAFLVVGAAAAALLIFGPVRRRLREVQEAASRIGAGDTTARAPEHGGDEVTALARSFNLMAADLQARATALAASDQARRQLLADVSHELMTPLTAMRGYLETLAMAELQLDPPTRERYLRIVDEETRRLERIVGDLLDLARLEGSGSPLRREMVSVASLFNRVANRHQRELEERRIRLTQRVAEGARQIAGDPDRLEQALQNLAANALRHTPEGGEIALIAEPRRSTGGAKAGIRIVVRDSGPGIAPEHLPLIFDRFYKADAARTTGGSGLGLSIVKAIVERHGGTITARNDGGAVFEIVLPDISFS
jgi:signal transduction histidine kinase